MEASKFANAYPLDINYIANPRGAEAPQMVEAREWSYKFGRMLYARLAGDDVEQEAVAMDEYQRWTPNVWQMEREFLDSDGGPDERLNKLNFHIINRSTRGMWRPIRDGTWGSEGTRLHSINEAQRSMAIHGLGYYGLRQAYVEDKGGPHVLFDTEEGKKVRRVLGGMIQEFDTAVILLEVMRRNPSLTMVPAPMNFECTKKATNVDFVVYDHIDNRAIGVQVKNMVHSNNLELADPERVVFVDGAVDFDNVLAMRTSKDRSCQKVVSWSGMVSAKLVDQMKLDRRKLPGARPTEQVKKLARLTVGNISVDHQGIADRIERRVKHKL